MDAEIVVREFREDDVHDMVKIWNRVIEDGVAFPQLDYLNDASGLKFFSEQTYTAVADIDGNVVGLYILHPNM